MKNKTYPATGFGFGGGRYQRNAADEMRKKKGGGTCLEENWCQWRINMCELEFVNLHYI